MRPVRIRSHEQWCIGQATQPIGLDRSGSTSAYCDTLAVPASTDPRPVRKTGNAQNVHPPGVELQHEEHIQPSQQDCVDVEEVAGQQPVRLHEIAGSPPPAAARDHRFRRRPADAQAYSGMSSARRTALDLSRTRLDVRLDDATRQPRDAVPESRRPSRLPTAPKNQPPEHPHHQQIVSRTATTPNLPYLLGRTTDRTLWHGTGARGESRQGRQADRLLRGSRTWRTESCRWIKASSRVVSP
jgi:hypothetical protein